jgi:small conductance mechanosensitive channel
MLKIGDSIPAINDGPWYKGVAEFTDRGVSIKVMAKCNEEDRPQTIRDLNRELKLLFDKHKIKVAVPKIEITNPKK